MTMGLIVDREPELVDIDVAIAGAAGGEGCLLVIEGESGIGKTELLAAARERAADRGAAPEALGLIEQVSLPPGYDATLSGAMLAIIRGRLRIAADEPAAAARLAAAELPVAQLAARGDSNGEIAQALFITPKTVENHLGRIYRKLEIGERGQLAGLPQLDAAASS